jgi:formylglycine-generating enzyme required for sulfatase activity
MKFAGLNYQPVSDLQSLKSALIDLERAKRGKAAELAQELRAKHPKAEIQTELIQHLNKHQSRSVREKRLAAILALLMLSSISAVCMVVLDGHLEEQRLSAEAKAKTKLDGLDFERLTSETKALFLRKVQTGVVGDKLAIRLSRSVSVELCFIPSGSFTMGSPPSEDARFRDEDQVEVTLSQPFWLAKTEVTQEQWVAVMGINPSHFKGARLPVENVYWYAAQTYVNKLNESEVLPKGWKFALPTAAQWEYACRAGEKGPYSGGSLDEIAWYDGNSESNTHEVGQKKPNAWGLQDMHGNVYEWCADWYSDTLRGGVDPKGPESGDKRVARGGSWFSLASGCRAAGRRSSTQGGHDPYLGFRLALVRIK